MLQLIFLRFTKRNLVMIVMIPAMVSIHWGWSKLQNVEVFVPKEDRRELPIIEVILLPLVI